MADECARRTAVIRLGIVVEGETEEEFIKRVVATRLIEQDIQATPILVGLKRHRSSRGGNVTVENVATQMSRLVHSFEAVTSLVDFYGFVNKGEATCQELEERITEAAHSKIDGPFDEQHVFAYVQQHEFESLLFADVTAFERILLDPPPSLPAELAAIRAQFASPEDINDHHDTAPSKRLLGAIPMYRKRIDGPVVAEAIGLERIRAECPRFDAWLNRLGALDTPRG